MSVFDDRSGVRSPGTRFGSSSTLWVVFGLVGFGVGFGVIGGDGFKVVVVEDVGATVVDTFGPMIPGTGLTVSGFGSTTGFVSFNDVASAGEMGAEGRDESARGFGGVDLVVDDDVDCWGDALETGVVAALIGALSMVLETMASGKEGPRM